MMNIAFKFNTLTHNQPELLSCILKIDDIYTEFDNWYFYIDVFDQADTMVFTANKKLSSMVKIISLYDSSMFHIDEDQKFITKHLSNMNKEFLDILIIDKTEGKDYINAALRYYVSDKIKSIGVKNFTVSDIEKFHKKSGTYPKYCSIEINPSVSTSKFKKLVDYCNRKHINILVDNIFGDYNNSRALVSKYTRPLMAYYPIEFIDGNFIPIINSLTLCEFVSDTKGLKGITKYLPVIDDKGISFSEGAVGAVLIDEDLYPTYSYNYDEDMLLSDAKFGRVGMFGSWDETVDSISNDLVKYIESLPKLNSISNYRYLVMEFMKGKLIDFTAKRKKLVISLGFMFDFISMYVNGEITLVIGLYMIDGDKLVTKRTKTSEFKYMVGGKIFIEPDFIKEITDGK
jgi:hypothetical protein